MKMINIYAFIGENFQVYSYCLLTGNSNLKRKNEALAHCLAILVTRREPVHLSALSGLKETAAR